MAAIEYDDLQLRIDRDADGSYRVLAMAPDGRTARGSFISPVDDDELDDFVQRVGLARRRGAGADTRMDAIRDLGSNLFDSLMKDDIGTVYYSARSAAAERDRGLRITLRLSGSPELMRLPWEFLYKRPRFIAQSTHTPVVRALDVDSAMRPQRLTLPLRILAMVSSPTGYPELDADAERYNLERALAIPREQGLVEVEWLERATLGELARRINASDSIHVLHYIGHGAYDESTDSGILVLETPQGRAHDVSGEEIGAMLQDETSLRLVVLNACEGARTSHVDPFSGVAAALVNFDIPAVIGMQFEITDDAAIAFSESLYTGLAHGLPVDAALAPARRAIVGAMLATEFGTPVLFLRDGDARLFDVQDAPPLPKGMVTDGLSVDEVVAEEKATDAAPPADAPPRPAEPVPVAAEQGRVPRSPIPDLPPPEPGRVYDERYDGPGVPYGQAAPGGAQHPAAGAAIADEPPLPDGLRRGPSVTISAAMAFAGAGLLAVAAALFAAGTYTFSSQLAAAGFGAQALATAALAVHYGTRPTHDAARVALLFGAGAVLNVITLMAIQDHPVATFADLAYGIVLVVIGGLLIRAARRGSTRYAVSLQAPAVWVIVTGAVVILVEVFWLSQVDWFHNLIWPLSTFAMAAAYVMTALKLTKEGAAFEGLRAFSPSKRDIRVRLPVTLAWTASVALVVMVLTVLMLYTGGNTDWVFALNVVQVVAITSLMAHHASRPRHDSRFAVVGYGVAVAVSLMDVAVVIIAQIRYEAYQVTPWLDLATGILLGVVGVWLSAVGRTRGGFYGRSLWIPGPFVVAAGAVTALSGAVTIARSSDLGPIIRWLWPITMLGMAAGYLLSSLYLKRESHAKDLRDG